MCAGLLHWFVGPYVHKLWFDARRDRVKVQMLSIFAQPLCVPSLLISQSCSSCFTSAPHCHLTKGCSLQSCPTAYLQRASPSMLRLKMVSEGCTLCSRFIEFQINDIKPPDSIAPLQTFDIHGRVMYVDEASFGNKELLQRLTPASLFDLETGNVERTSSESADVARSKMEATEGSKKAVK
jgi:hypothetical protein